MSASRAPWRVAALLGRAGGQAYYDTVLDITWLADASYARTSGYDSDGYMTWDEAQTWVGVLNTANHLGVNNWRLPRTLQPDPSCSEQQDGWGSHGFNCTGGEMGHLHDVDGINWAQPDPFINIPISSRGDYWSETAVALDPETAWVYNFFNGVVGAAGLYVQWSVHTWAVRDGDISPVPAPGALWLFGTGVVALGAKLKRRARDTLTAA